MASGSSTAAPSYALSTWSLASTSTSTGSSSAALTKRDPSIPSPPGFSSLAAPASSASSSSKKKDSATASSTVSRRPTPAQHSALQQAKAWEIALGPAKSLPMNAIMLYMSGSGVQIFSMMAVGMLVMNPIKALTAVDQPFQRLTSSQHSLLLQKTAYIACQLACIALGLYKCWSMGLLPTESSDWLAWKQPRVPIEFSPTRN
ncbi:hypothetical protein OC846_004953 [Tilletia horrida]|uniref:ER membrane protein complex subunit 4 n=1 Tax=Tilletia horrida TaxID=155126 RepID=A0AAN6GM73_9BASI|nr:hypothetical protein OC846_004953 [Tilletia horrida]KAK0563776.1 hypothetical protein OC861_004622 [Tilletia horrida]